MEEGHPVTGKRLVELPDGLTIVTGGGPEGMDYVRSRLLQLNIDRTDGRILSPGHGIDLLLRDGRGAVIGGVSCDTFLQSMRIAVLWVDDGARGRGYGGALLDTAEGIGREAGCLFAHTSTFSYQAPGFYKRKGYTVFGVLDGFPDSVELFYLRKSLV